MNRKRKKVCYGEAQHDYREDKRFAVTKRDTDVGLNRRSPKPIAVLKILTLLFVTAKLWSEIPFLRETVMLI